MLPRPVISLSIAVIVIVIDYSVTSVAPPPLVFRPAYIIYSSRHRVAPPAEGKKKDMHGVEGNVISGKLHDVRPVSAAHRPHFLCDFYAPRDYYSALCHFGASRCFISFFIFRDVFSQCMSVAVVVACELRFASQFLPQWGEAEECEVVGCMTKT